ncbi:uncharacterized protein TrAtP1_010466 [Trichoderma atroviride]|uniref:Uncharacterized protein n=1 Tax=Hypocrea atroviridis (strain ATCC 20476 / IMI 206040) TaxID=452589 RepID=G9NQV7_HYPAI|nr:uncharacterized protein TRIATDRAFT_306663 [Trichoderma atroviride IMI 206040]EHK46927.1 hypothetical protein TRIATDRAFT_306663 [Trichoderma atroviride IMI 206040]UKZ69458.1 hypothetical protein TrAtP1_010466 [Trichoderma atroviride]
MPNGKPRYTYRHGSDIILARPYHRYNLANPTQMGSREIPKNVHAGQHRMRGFDATTIGSRARMSQSDSQDVIFITVGQEKKEPKYFRPHLRTDVNPSCGNLRQRIRRK